MVLEDADMGIVIGHASPSFTSMSPSQSHEIEALISLA
jgi:hypothetical protein